MKTITVILAGLSLSFSLSAQHAEHVTPLTLNPPQVKVAEPIPLQATLTTASVAHALFQPGDEKVPHPVYTEFCGEQLDPRPYPHATGSATLLFDPETNELKYSISYGGLSGPPIMMHFHYGEPGVTGPIVQTISGEPTGDSKGLGWTASPPTSGDVAPKGMSGFITGVYKVQGNPHLTPALSQEEEVQALLGGKIYINIHTCLNELGELRGQILPLAIIPAKE